MPRSGVYNSVVIGIRKGNTSGSVEGDADDED
jgi:hypothetical protein